jgi:hypothetical protein
MIVRPVGEEAAWAGDYRYMLGEALLVAPILDASGMRDIELPGGARWYDCGFAGGLGERRRHASGGAHVSRGLRRRDGGVLGGGGDALGVGQIPGRDGGGDDRSALSNSSIRCPTPVALWSR